MTHSHTIITCANSHELGLDGKGGDVDASIQGCELADGGNNLACTHCTKKYFSFSAVENAQKRIGKITGHRNIRKIFLFELKLLRDVGELMDKLKAYHTLKKTLFLKKIDDHYPKICSFFELLQSFEGVNEGFINEYRTLLSDCIKFIIKSVKSIRKGEVIPSFMVDFLAIKTRRDVMLRVWSHKLEQAEQK